MEDFNLSEILTPDSAFAVTESPDVQALVGDLSDFTTAAKEPEAEHTEEATGDQPAVNYESLVQELGGVEIVNALKPLLEADGDAVETLSQIIPQDAIEGLVWQTLNSPGTAEIVLADPEVRAAISEQLFGGIPLEEIQDALEAYGLEPGFEGRQQARQAEFAQLQAIEGEVQEAIFYQPTLDLAKSLGVDPEKDEATSAKLELEYHRYVKAHQADLTRLVQLRVTGKTTQATLAQARLQNAWSARVVKALQGAPKAQPKPQAKAHAANQPAKATTPTKQAEYGSSEWLSELVNSFSAERKAKGF